MFFYFLQVIIFKLDCHSETKHQILLSKNNLNNKENEFDTNERLDLSNILSQLKEWKEISKKCRVLCEESV